MLGTAQQLRDLKMHPVELREMVTSPGGTTIAAIRELEIAGVRAAFLNAIQAAMVRSRELARAARAPNSPTPGITRKARGDQRDPQEQIHGRNPDATPHTPAPSREDLMKGSMAGWIGFAGIVMLIVGFIDFFQGLIALFKDDYFVVTSSGYLAINLTVGAG